MGGRYGKKEGGQKGRGVEEKNCMFFEGGLYVNVCVRVGEVQKLCISFAEHVIWFS